MKPPFTRRRVSTLRFIVQLLFFAFLMYAGYIATAMGAWTEYAETDEVSGPPTIKTVFKRPTTTNIFIPATACVFQKQGFCKACSLYFLTDAITWLKPVEVILPGLLLLLLFMLLAGRLWCGWVCPMGLLSDLLTRLRTWLGVSQVRLSKGWREGLIWTKYLLLLLTLVLAAVAAFPSMADQRLSLVDPFCQVCPQRIFAAFFSLDQVCWMNTHDNITTTLTTIGLIAFGVFFIGLTVRRFWCRVCPIGAVTVLFNRTGLVMLRKNAQKCTRCGACVRSCPLDVQRVYKGRGREVVTSYECHLCLRCVEACPENDCLEFRWLGKKVTGS